MDSDTFMFSISMIVAGIATIASLISALIVTYHRSKKHVNLSDSQRIQLALEKIEEIQKDIRKMTGNTSG